MWRKHSQKMSPGTVSNARICYRLYCLGQSSKRDIIVCRKNFYRRQLAGDIFLVEPNDCIMVIEVKGNATLDDLTETIEKINFSNCMMKQNI